jgi:type I restriction enzyme S subunit
MSSDRVPFRRLVEFAIGGGWGSDVSKATDDVSVTIIRGTDFARVHAQDFSGCPRRFETAKRVAKRRLRGGDIVLEISGGSPRTSQSTGRSLFISDGIANSTDGVIIPASFCRRISVDSSVAESRFAYFLLQDMWQAGRARRYENQSTGISNFAFERFLDEEYVWLPGLDEQRAIIAVLAALDGKVESNRRFAMRLEEAAKTVFRARFVWFVGESDFIEGDLGRMPKGWALAPIGSVLRVVGGGTPSTKEARYWDGGTYCWATPKDLSESDSRVLLDTKRHITSEGVNQISSGMLPRRTVLLSSRAPIGYLALSWVDVAVNQGFVAIPPSGAIPSEFVLCWLHENLDRIKAHAGGTTFAEISKRAFRPIPMVVPSAAALADFEGTVRPMFDLLAGQEMERQTLLRVREALLPKLVSGRIRVPDTEDPEEVIGPIAEQVTAVTR